MERINVKRSILLRMSEKNEHILAMYKRYQIALTEIEKLQDARQIANDTVDDTLAIDQLIHHFEKNSNDAAASLNWVARELELDKTEGVKFTVFI